MDDVIRIGVQEARDKTSMGKALLVCAYDKDEKFMNNRLDGAISLADFESRVPGLHLGQEIIFYCN